VSNSTSSHDDKVCLPNLHGVEEHEQYDDQYFCSECTSGGLVLLLQKLKTCVMFPRVLRIFFELRGAVFGKAEVIRQWSIC